MLLDVYRNSVTDGIRIFVDNGDGACIAFRKEFYESGEFLERMEGMKGHVEDHMFDNRTRDSSDLTYLETLEI